MPPHRSPCPSGKGTRTGLGTSGARGCRARRPGSAAAHTCARHGPRCSGRGPASARPRGLWRDCLRGRTLLRCHPRIPAHTTRRAPGPRRFRGWRGAAFGGAPQTNHLPRALRPGPATFACAGGGGWGPLELGGAQLLAHPRAPPDSPRASCRAAERILAVAVQQAVGTTARGRARPTTAIGAARDPPLERVLELADCAGPALPPLRPAP